MEIEKPAELAWHVDNGKAVITLGVEVLACADAPKDNPKEVHEKIDELCLRYNTWPQLWLALKAAERGDKHWLEEVQAAVRAAGQEGPA